MAKQIARLSAVERIIVEAATILDLHGFRCRPCL
jgi:hypothetical protein